MGRGKKQQSRKGSGPPYAQVVAAVVVLLGVLWAAFWGERGCTEMSALNFNPGATVDDGTCVGSMYDQTGVFEFQTTAAAAPKQLEAIGIEFEHNVGQQMVVVTKVTSGSVAASNGVRQGDELLAVKDKATTILVSSRGQVGTINAVQHVMGAWPGTPLTWVLRHAAALGGIEDIELVSIAAAPYRVVLPALSQELLRTVAC